MADIPPVQHPEPAPSTVQRIGLAGSQVKSDPYPPDASRFDQYSSLEMGSLGQQPGPSTLTVLERTWNTSVPKYCSFYDCCVLLKTLMTTDFTVSKEALRLRVTIPMRPVTWYGCHPPSSTGSP